MTRNGRLSHQFSRLALLATCASSALTFSYSALAQQAAPTSEDEAIENAIPLNDPNAAKDDGRTSGDIVVTGKRLGFATTSQIKRDAPQSVSVLTTTDLRNIPDTVLIDIVRRIPGVQVSQGGGGGIVSVRGLPQAEVRLNGRNFPSSVSRGFNSASLPGDIVSGVAVYKTPTVDQIEGGVAAIIDFRTRRPFDFDGFAAAATLKGVYTNIDDKVDPVVSGYVSDRWKMGDADFGLILGGSYQKQRNSLDLLVSDGNTLQTSAGGTNVDAPTNFNKRYFFFNRELWSLYGGAQFRLGDLESVIDVLYGKVDSFGGTQTLQAQLSAGTPTGPFSLYPNSNVFRSGTYRDVPMGSYTDVFGQPLESFQIGWNNTYTPDDRTTLVLDVAYNSSTGSTQAYGTALNAQASTVSYNQDQSFPFYTVTGFDQKSPAVYTYGYLYEQIAQDTTKNFQARVDGTYEFDGLVRALQFGLRYDRRTIDRTGGFGFAPAPAGIAPVAQNPYIGLTPDRLYTDNGVEQRQWASIAPSALRNGLPIMRDLFGLGVTPNNPAQAYDGVEKTWASYASAKLGFEVVGIPVDGNVGVRVVKTDLTLNGTRTGATAGTRVAITSSSSYVDVLPAINLRLTLAPELFLRLAYSKQLSRPSFASVSPIVTLNTAGTGQRTGSAGNPDLKPLRADQFDVSLEHYFGPDNSIYTAGFYKSITGFVANAVTTLRFDGIPYQITRPENLNKGYVAGAEIGYRHTFSFLPGALSGLGLQGSYTYVDGTRRPNRVGIITPYEQITKHNYQVSGFYNKYGISANVNWVWRSRLLEVTAADPRGRPDYRIPFGQLDANLLYQLNPRLTLQISGQNLTQSLIRRSFQDTRFFAQNALENRRILAGVQIKLGGGI